MTILDRRDTGRIRIDVARLADELARRLPAIDDITKILPAVDAGDAGDAGDPAAAAADALRGAGAMARERLDRASELARDVTRDLARAGSDLHLETRLDDATARLRTAAAGMPSFAQIVARLERELPTTDRDRYDRAYLRGRVQARSRYVAVGIVVGVTTGVVAAILLDPRHGKERREAIGRSVSGATSGLTKRATGAAQAAGERARGLAAQRGQATQAAAEPAGVVDAATDGVLLEASAADQAGALATAPADPQATQPAAEPVETGDVVARPAEG